MHFTLSRLPVRILVAVTILRDATCSPGLETIHTCTYSTLRHSAALGVRIRLKRQLDMDTTGAEDQKHPPHYQRTTTLLPATLKKAALVNLVPQEKKKKKKNLADILYV